MTLLTTSEDIASSIGQLISDTESSSPILVAVAYWGIDSHLLLPLERTFRVVCNLQSNGTNPNALRSLILRTNVEARTCSNLHGKVLVGGSSILVGSANFSNAALGITQPASLREAAVYSTDPEEIASACSWFWDEVWASSMEITETLLRDAEANWGHHRPRPEQNLQEALFLKPRITGNNKIRMAARSIETLYNDQIQPLDKTNVRVPAFVANLLWVFLGNSIETRFSNGFYNTSQVWARIYDPASKQPGYLRDHILQLLDILDDHGPSEIARTAVQYKQTGYPGIEHQLD